jgi:hypothetical protein
VERQPILPEALGEHSQHLLRVLLELKAHDHIVRKTEDERPTSQSWNHLLSEPQVEDIVKINVAE